MIFETLKIDEESHAENESLWIKRHVGVIIMVCCICYMHTLYIAMCLG